MCLRLARKGGARPQSSWSSFGSAVAPARGQVVVSVWSSTYVGPMPKKTERTICKHIQTTQASPGLAGYIWLSEFDQVLNFKSVRFEPKLTMCCTADISNLMSSRYQHRIQKPTISNKGASRLLTSLISLDRAARIPAKNAVVYTRYLNGTVEDVWPTISTAEGLSKWWVAPVSAFELKPGGAFNHHWNSFVVDFEEQRFIDFKKQLEIKTDEIMRFEIASVDEARTRFTLLDAIEADVVAVDNEPQPHGPGTIWAGVAAGWHCSVDALERLFNPRLPVQDWHELIEFYEVYLAEQFGIIDLVH